MCHHSLTTSGPSAIDINMPTKGSPSCQGSFAPSRPSAAAAGEVDTRKPARAVKAAIVATFTHACRSCLRSIICPPNFETPENSCVGRRQAQVRRLLYAPRRRAASSAFARPSVTRPDEREHGALWIEALENEPAAWHLHRTVEDLPARRLNAPLGGVDVVDIE